MFRFMFRLVVLVAVLIGGAILYYQWNRSTPDLSAIGTSGDLLNSERARRAGAEIAETVAAGASKAEKALAEGRLTAKIKSKMALDDTIDSGDVGVETTGTTVTLTGTVATEAQHQRVLALAKETAGVTKVVDNVKVKGR
jgi:osmotically-inducible protein OsmY